MSKIDLSKAKIGDKFRTRNGQILEYVDKDQGNNRGDKFIIENEEGSRYHFYKYGNYMSIETHYLDLVEQVFDDEKDTTDLEIVEAMNKAINENSEKVAEEKQELQRRKEVVELARKMLFDDNTYQFYTQFYVRAKQNEGAEQVMTYLQYVIDYAEDCVNKFIQYLKEGKL